MTSVVTVPGKNFGTVSLVFAADATASLATNLLASVYSAGSALVVGVAPSSATVSGAVSEYIIAPTVTGAVTVPAGYNTILDAATGPITITGNGGSAETFIATSAASTAPGGGFLLYNLGAGTVLAGSGADTIVNPATNVGLTALGDASFVAFVPGGVVNVTGVVIVAGSATVTGTGAVVYGTGTNALLANNGGADTFVAGGGTSTIDAMVSGGVYFDLAGPMVFVNGGSGSVVAGNFASTGFSGSGNSAYFLGAGQFTLYNGPSSSSIVGASGTAVAWDSNGGLVDLFGTSSGNYLYAGAGAETLASPFSTGNNVFTGSFNNQGATEVIYLGGVPGPDGKYGQDGFVAGTSSATVLGGATNIDTFEFDNGVSNGSNTTIFNFNSYDIIDVVGYAIQYPGDPNPVPMSQTTITGGMQLTLPNNTVITIAGISSVPSSQIHIAGHAPV